MSAETIALAFTGASGLPYGVRLLECLLAAGKRVQLVYSKTAQTIARQEMDFELSGDPGKAEADFSARFGAAPGQLRAYGLEDWFSPLASGSNPPDAYVVCPCSMSTLARIAAGIGDDLLTRAADVMLKEGRPLILVPRETPFSGIHLENMLRLSRAGAVILPPSPAFYHHPQSVQDMIDFIVARILDRLGIPHALAPRWGAGEGE